MEYNIEAEATVLAEFEAWWLEVDPVKLDQLYEVAMLKKAGISSVFVKEVMFLGYRQGYAKGWLSLLAQVREKYGLLNE